MKKLFALLLAVMMVISMAACAANEPATTTAPKATTPATQPAGTTAAATTTEPAKALNELPFVEPGSVKITIGLLTSGISIIADSLNNLSDAGSSALTLFGYALSGKPADKEHPYGPARIEYLCGLFISVMGWRIRTRRLYCPYGKLILADRRGLRVTVIALSEGDLHRCLY